MAPKKAQKGKGKQKASERAPTSIGVKKRQSAASMKGSSQKIMVRHREFLGSVYGSVAFEWDQHMVNPGVMETFPWLSAIANRYESYRFQKLDVTYEPRVSSLTAGAVTILADFDPTEVGPDTLAQAMSYSKAVRGSAWSRLTMVTKSEDRDVLRKRYVRNSAEFAPVQEHRTTDLCSLFICTDGQTGTEVLGELWVDYEVEFTTPEIPGGESVATAINRTTVGDLVESVLKGVNVDESTARAANIPFTIANGVMTFIDDAVGMITYSVKSAANPGAFVYEGGPGSSYFYPSRSTVPVVNIAPTAGVGGIFEMPISAAKGNKMNIRCSNSSAADGNPRPLQFLPVRYSDLTTIVNNMGGSWTTMTGF